MHVLLIEPDRLLAATYAEALGLDGHSVDTVSSAQAAVHAADLRKPDVVVLEIQLRHHNGIEFLYEFRSYSEWLDIPIVVHTFVPPAELASAATLEHELGVRTVLHKPVTSLQTLRRTVTALTAATA